MKFTEYLTIQEAITPPQKKSNKIKGEGFDKKEVPAFARNAGKDLQAKLPKMNTDKDVGINKSGLDVPAYKRTSGDEGKSIEDAARKGRFPAKPKPAPGTKTKYEIDREKEDERNKMLLSVGKDRTPPSPTGGRVESFEKEVLAPFKSRYQKK